MVGKGLFRFVPVASFFCGVIWDALTLGVRVKALDFWRLGGVLGLAAILAFVLARRDYRGTAPPDSQNTAASRWERFLWQFPYPALQFCFGSLYSALFILYAKSSSHFTAGIGAAVLGALLVANEFWGARYGSRYSLIWAFFAFCASLLMNFALPFAAGSLNPIWFYLSTAVGVGLAHLLRLCSPGRPGRIVPAWAVGLALMGAWRLDMVAPVPLVTRDVAIGQEFVKAGSDYRLRVEPAAPWQIWRDWAATLHVPDQGQIYAVSAVFSPRGVTAALEHRWERQDESGSWHRVGGSRFTLVGGREQGFRGYSYVTNPAPGAWRLVVATQDGRTVATTDFEVVRGTPARSQERRY